MLRKPALLLIIFTIVHSLCFAAKDNVSFSGYGAAGYTFFDRLHLNEANQEAYFEGKLQADIEISKKIEAQLDLRGKSSDHSVNFREFSIKFNFFDFMNLKVGNIKRPFGFEQMVNREELITVERSYVQNRLSELGFGGRNISVMAYNKYSKDEGIPISYYASMFKDNSSSFGLGTRLRYHAGKTAYSFSYLFQKTGSTPSIYTQGFGLDFAIEKKKYTNSIELFLVQDPVEGLRRKLINEDKKETVLDEKVYTAGAKILIAYKFPAKYDFLKGIEPMALFSYFLPNMDIKESRVIQALLGANFIMDKDVAFRLNIDLRFSKNEFNDSYTTNDSRAVFEIQAKF